MKKVEKWVRVFGNVIDPNKVVKVHGADILRLWVISSDYQSDISISDNILKQVAETYRKIRNTSRYILGNISDFDPNKDMVEYNELPEIDKWAIMKINELVKTVTEGYDVYQFNKAYYGINSFLVHDMSTFYLDIIKDRLYVEGKTSKERRAAQTAMYIILSKLVRILAPITSYTAEEIWKYMPKTENENTFSIMLEDYPKYDEKLYNKELDDKFKKIIEIKELASKKLEEAREEKLIGQTLEAKVTVSANKENELYKIIENNKNLIEDVLIVSELELKEDSSIEKEELSVNISRAEGEKCERCWKYTKDVGIDKENPTICKRCSEVLKKYAKDYEI